MQRRFNISYEIEPAKDRLAMIHERLLKNQCRYNLIYSLERYLDILPFRASKGKAIRYLTTAAGRLADKRAYQAAVPLYTKAFDLTLQRVQSMGAPNEDIKGNSVTNGGAVVVLYGSSDGLKAEGNQIFTQNTPDEGQPVSQRTELRTVYTKDAIYFSFVLYDEEPDRIIISDSRLILTDDKEFMMNLAEHTHGGRA